MYALYRFDVHEVWKTCKLVWAGDAEDKRTHFGDVTILTCRYDGAQFRVTAADLGLSER